MSLGLKWNGGYHDEDDVVLILMSLTILKIEVMSSYTRLQKMTKRVIYRAKWAICHLICTCYFGRSKIFQEFFPFVVGNLFTRVVHVDGKF